MSSDLSTAELLEVTEFLQVGSAMGVSVVRLLSAAAGYPDIEDLDMERIATATRVAYGCGTAHSELLAGTPPPPLWFDLARSFVLSGGPLGSSHDALFRSLLLHLRDDLLPLFGSPRYRGLVDEWVLHLPLRDALLGNARDLKANLSALGWHEDAKLLPDGAKLVLSAPCTGHVEMHLAEAPARRALRLALSMLCRTSDAVQQTLCGETVQHRDLTLRTSDGAEVAYSGPFPIDADPSSVEVRYTKQTVLDVQACHPPLEMRDCIRRWLACGKTDLASVEASPLVDAMCLFGHRAGLERLLSALTRLCVQVVCCCDVEATEVIDPSCFEAALSLLPADLDPSSLFATLDHVVTHSDDWAPVVEKLRSDETLGRPLHFGDVHVAFKDRHGYSAYLPVVRGGQLLIHREQLELMERQPEVTFHVGPCYEPYDRIQDLSDERVVTRTGNSSGSLSRDVVKRLGFWNIRNTIDRRWVDEPAPSLSALGRVFRISDIMRKLGVTMAFSNGDEISVGETGDVVRRKDGTAFTSLRWREGAPLPGTYTLAVEHDRCFCLGTEHSFPNFQDLDKEIQVFDSYHEAKRCKNALFPTKLDKHHYLRFPNGVVCKNFKTTFCGVNRKGQFLWKDGAGRLCREGVTRAPPANDIRGWSFVVGDAVTRQHSAVQNCLTEEGGIYWRQDVWSPKISLNAFHKGKMQYDPTFREGLFAGVRQSPVDVKVGYLVDPFACRCDDTVSSSLDGWVFVYPPDRRDEMARWKEKKTGPEMRALMKDILFTDLYWCRWSDARVSGPRPNAATDVASVVEVTPSGIVRLSNGMAFEVHDREWRRLPVAEDLTGLAIMLVQSGYTFQFPNTSRRIPLLDALCDGAIVKLADDATILTGAPEPPVRPENFVTQQNGIVRRNEYAFRFDTLGKPEPLLNRPDGPVTLETVGHIVQAMRSGYTVRACSGVRASAEALCTSVRALFGEVTGHMVAGHRLCLKLSEVRALRSWSERIVAEVCEQLHVPAPARDPAFDEKILHALLFGEDGPVLSLSTDAHARVDGDRVLCVDGDPLLQIDTDDDLVEMPSERERYTLVLASEEQPPPPDTVLVVHVTGKKKPAAEAGGDRKRQRTDME